MKGDSTDAGPETAKRPNDHSSPQEGPQGRVPLAPSQLFLRFAAAKDGVRGEPGHERARSGVSHARLTVAGSPFRRIDGPWIPEQSGILHLYRLFLCSRQDAMLSHSLETHGFPALASLAAFLRGRTPVLPTPFRSIPARCTHASKYIRSKIGYILPLCSRQESNLHRFLRREASYPLNDESK